MSESPTGERFVPGLDGKIALEHWHRYRLAARLVPQKDVLDVACGEGYGSAFLAGSGARSVVGIDIDAQTVLLATERYKAPGLRFQASDCTELPLPDACMDLVVSFETIEHHNQHDKMLCEFSRVLRPDGQLLLSSPDRVVYSQQEGHQNPFHVKELDRLELLSLLEAHFPHVQLWGQRAQTVSLIAREHSPAPLHWESAPPAWEYLVALCSHQPLTNTPLTESLFCLPEDPLRSLERHYQSLEESYRHLEGIYGSLEGSYQSLEESYRRLEAQNTALQQTELLFQAREREFQALTQEREALEERFLALEADARRWYPDSQMLQALRGSRTFNWAKRLASYLKEKELWQ